MSDLIFIQTDYDTFVVGKGPFIFSRTPTHDRSFYVNDFFLNTEEPWVTPHTSELLSRSAFADLLNAKSKSSAEIDWQIVKEQEFVKAFESAKKMIQSGELKKVVPVLFESGKIPSAWGSSIIEHATSRLIAYAHPNLFLYGYSHGESGFCGATPEFLFRMSKEKVSTAALAGTKAAILGVHAVENLKDSSEHKMVVDDITERLSTYGMVHKGVTLPYNIGNIFHLRTEISLTQEKPLQFEELVKTLHPTAALGIFPRSDFGMKFLFDQDKGIQRGSFGAPFGIHFIDGSENGVCLVAIRSLQWDGTDGRIGSGCGIIAESVLEQELQELQLKRDSVKEKLRKII